MAGDTAIWQEAESSQLFLAQVRKAIPMAQEQVDIILRILQETRPNIENFLDLGCGDGILGHAILDSYPKARGVFLDFSESMIQQARLKTRVNTDQVTFVTQDFWQSDWIDSVHSETPFDVIVSGFAIHHVPDERKKEIYGEIYSLLKPGGVFLNLEHVSAKYPWIEKIFETLFIDSLYSSQQQNGSTQSREEVAQELYYRPDKQADIFAPLEDQCNWLKEVGFTQVDCFFKLLELALFGGIKPTEYE